MDGQTDVFGLWFERQSGFIEETFSIFTVLVSQDDFCCLNGPSLSPSKDWKTRPDTSGQTVSLCQLRTGLKVL